MESLHSGSAYVNLICPFIGLVSPYSEEKRAYTSHHSGRVGRESGRDPTAVTKRRGMWGAGEMELGEPIQL